MKSGNHPLAAPASRALTGAVTTACLHCSAAGLPSRSRNSGGSRSPDLNSLCFVYSPLSMIEGFAFITHNSAGLWKQSCVGWVTGSGEGGGWWRRRRGRGPDFSLAFSISTSLYHHSLFRLSFCLGLWNCSSSFKTHFSVVWFGFL